MDLRSHHGDRHVLGGYATRTLDSAFPELKEFLRGGAQVLDVGCGPGTITLDVAALVSPGRVVGLDSSRASVASGKERADSAGGASVDFVLGDACSLPFGVRCFDLIYSHALFGWLRDPVRALVEQHRVVRAGGWVVHPIGDLDTHTMYPPCPNLEAVFASWRLLSDGTSDTFVQDSWAAKNMVAYLRQAGFGEIQTRARIERFRSLGGLCTFLLDPTGTLRSAYACLFERGALAEATLEAARDEVAAWQTDPSRYYYQTTIVFVARP